MQSPYQGTCRNKDPETVKALFAIRLRAAGAPIEISDQSLGLCQWQPESVGDFIIKRKDGLFAYQLAVVVDDAFTNVTHVVRGVDLLDSTPRQIMLQRALNLPTPAYRHVPLVTGADGDKLSKQTGAPPLLNGTAFNNLQQALRFLKISAKGDTIEQMLNAAVKGWIPAVSG